MIELIPLPATIVPAEGYFEFYQSKKIFISPDSEEMFRIGWYLSNRLHRLTGILLPVSSDTGITIEGAIYLTTQFGDKSLGSEGYTLRITPASVQIAALQPAGVFYGVQTLQQLLPPDIGPTPDHSIPTTIASVSIQDQPRFSWRGTMLDVARHFFGVEEIKGYIDLLASYKLNRLHLHLTDDQGWRIEIRSWPKLTTFGGETAVGGDPGGFYKQAEFIEIITYAQQRYITIVPEIDMPGHTNAALASYPELNCDGIAPERYTGMEVGFSSLCIERENSYQFIRDVLQEVASLIPGEYIHIGGDEAHSTPIDAYNKFIERIEPLVLGLGKQMIGWEEIIQCNLSDSAIIQYWKDVRNATMAYREGKKIIFSPAQKVYLDMKYHPETPFGLTWAGTIDVEKAYRWDPTEEISGLDDEAILGVEAPLWTETLRTIKDVEFMAFPRLLGIAEIGWSPLKERMWEDYRHRLAAQGKRLNSMKVNYYLDPSIPWD